MSRLVGLTHELVDDAAVFPPGNAPLAKALTAHYELRHSRYEELVGPLLVPASAVGELRRLADPTSLLRVAVIGDTGLEGLVAARDALQDDSWLNLAHLELRLMSSEDPMAAARTLLGALPFTVPTYIELPHTIDWAPVLAVIAEDGAERAKFRCGPDDVPDTMTLAGFLLSCATLRVPFKLTAGLHHALPHETAHGIVQHGFLNTLAATWAAMDGATLEDVASLLEVRDPEILLHVLDAAHVAKLRDLYRSFGSCSIVEPYDELDALQLIEEVR